jgi:predicted enzyme related to lactoylglutathione lyase
VFYISTTVVFVSDQDKAKDFYVNKLGFELVSDAQTMPGYRWLQVTPPGAQTGVVLSLPMEGHEAGKSSGLLLYTDDIQALHQQWAANGVEFSEAPTQYPWGWQAQLADPDGNGIVLTQPRHKAKKGESDD